MSNPHQLYQGYNDITPSGPNPVVKLACRTCRAKKIRCDGAQPCLQCSISNIACEYPTEIKKRGPKKKNIIMKTKYNLGPPSTMNASLTILSNKINFSVLMKEYINVYDETISIVAGVRIPKYDLRSFLNDQTLDVTSALVYSLMAHGARALGNNEQGQQFIDKAELASKNFLGSISFEAASLYHLIGHFHFGSGNFPSAYLFLHLSKTILDAFKKFNPQAVNAEFDSVYNEVVLSLAELNADPQQKYLAYAEMEERVKTGEIDNSMGIMATLVGKLRSSILIQSPEVTEEYVEGTLNAINVEYEASESSSAKRQITPLIMAINAFANLSLNRTEKALQYSDACLNYVSYAPAQGRSVTYPLALQIVGEVCLQTNAPQLPTNLELLGKMTEYFPIASLVKQGFEAAISQQIQLAASDSQSPEYLADSSSPEFAINSASDELLSPPDIINQIFGPNVNNNNTDALSDPLSAEELFDSIPGASPDIDYSQLNFM